MRYAIPYNDTKCHHTAKRKSPLGHADGDEAGLAEAALHRSLEAVCSGELAVDDDEADGPVDDDCQRDEQEDAGQQARVLESVRLANDPRAYDAVGHVHEGGAQAALGPVVVLSPLGAAVGPFRAAVGQ